MLIRCAHDELVLLKTLLQLRAVCRPPIMVKILGHNPVYAVFIKYSLSLAFLP